MPFIAFPVLFVASINAPNTKQAAKYGFVFGFGWFGFGVSWVHNAIADFGGLPIVLSLLLMFFLVSYLAAFSALASALLYKLHAKFSVFIIIPIWLFVEYLRSVLFTGFPWLSIGYSQLTSSLSGYAPVVGEFGLQVIVMLVVSLILYVLTLNKSHRETITTLDQASVEPTAQKNKFFIPALSSFSILIIFITGYLLSQIVWIEPKNKDVNLALVQGNIAQSIKWQPENEVPTMVKYAKLTASHWNSSDIIIWPEAAIPRLEVSAGNFLKELEKVAVESNSALITGIVDYQPQTTDAYNNVIGLGKQQEHDTAGQYHYLHNNRYSKHHLLPFGEFVPFESILRKLAPIFDLPFSSFNEGDYLQNNIAANGMYAVPAICFEIAFPRQINANITNNSDFILTLSNDTWFGDSHGPWQHLQIAQMRALEFAMPVIRATNDGVTAVIDTKGNIAATMEQGIEGVLTHKLALSSSHSFYKAHGNLTTLVLVLLLTFSLLIKAFISNSSKEGRSK